MYTLGIDIGSTTSKCAILKDGTELVVDASGNVIASEDTVTPAARVNLLLEEGYTEQFYKELNAGSLRLVKVWK